MIVMTVVMTAEVAAVEIAEEVVVVTVAAAVETVAAEIAETGN